MFTWFVSAVAISAPPKMPKKPLALDPVPIPTNEICFPSGFRLQLYQRPAAGAVAIAMVVGAGTAHEDEQTRGVAHLVEHLWFQARPDQAPRLWDRTAGLRFQATTFPDATVYTTVGAAQDLGRLLEIEAARLADPLAGIAEAQLEDEKEVIRSESVVRGEHSDRHAMRYLDAARYPEGHPYHPGTSAVRNLERLDLPTVRQWAATHYVPANVTLRVEGDLPTLDGKQWATMLERSFPETTLYLGNSTCPPPTPGPPPPLPDMQGLMQIEAGVLEPTLFVGFSLPPAHGADTMRVRLAARLLTRILAIRLRHSVAGLKQDKAYGVSCAVTPGLHASELNCRIRLSSGVPLGQTYRSVASSLDWMTGIDMLDQRRTFLADEIGRNFSQALLDADDFDDEALTQRALMGHFSGEIDPLAPAIRAAFSLREPEVRELAERWLGKKRLAGIALVPAGVPRGEGKPVTGKARLTVPAQEPWAAPTLDPATFSKRSLDNGVEIWSVRAGLAPAAQVHLSVPSGPVAAPSAGTDELLDHVVHFPVHGDGWELMQARGFTLYQQIHSGARAFYSEGFRKSLNAMLWMNRVRLEDIYVNFDGRQAKLDALFDWQFEAFERWPWSTSRNRRLQRLLGDHRTGVPWWEHVRSARAVPEKELRDWVRTTFHPEDATLLVVGNVEHNLALSQGFQYFDSWKSKKRPAPVPVPPLPPPPEQQVLVLAYEGLLSDVKLSCRAPGRTTDTDAALDVLEAVLTRGMLQSLRDDAASYTPTVELEGLFHGLTLIHLSADVRPAQSIGAADTMMDLLQQVKAGISDDVLSWAKQEAAGRWGRQWTSARAAMRALGNEVAVGMGPEDVKDWPERLERVDASSLSALLEDCVDHEVVTIIGAPTELVGVEMVDWKAEGAALVESLR